jgi:hypothetical protein
MTPYQKSFAVHSAAHLMRNLGIDPSFVAGKSEVTTHDQVAGEYKGEVLVKVYQSGTPSFTCMMRPVKGVFYPIVLKRDALELQP